MWISSAEFAEKFGLEYETLKKACVRAKKAHKKFCKIKCNILLFSYIHGKGGKSGQVLRLWDEPFESESAAVEFLSAESKGQGADTLAKDNENLSVDTMDTSATPQYDKFSQNPKFDSLPHFNVIKARNDGSSCCFAPFAKRRKIHKIPYPVIRVLYGYFTF